MADYRMQSGDIEARRAALLNKTGYPCVQIEGQRLYGPPAFWQGEAPPHGCEVYVSGIPKDVYEDEIVPVFETVGLIYQLRLMMDFNDQTRGFCYVEYQNSSQAQNAIRLLNGTLIRNRSITVKISSQNRKILVKDLPTFVNQADVMIEMMRLTKGVHDVLRLDHDDTSMLVIYERHRDAALARKVLLAPDLRCWGRKIGIDWAVGDARQGPECITHVSRFERLERVCTELSFTLVTRILRLAKPDGNGHFFLCALRIPEACLIAKPLSLCETVEQAETLAVLTLQAKLDNWFKQEPSQLQLFLNDENVVRAPETTMSNVNEGQPETLMGTTSNDSERQPATLT